MISETSDWHVNCVSFKQSDDSNSNFVFCKSIGSLLLSLWKTLATRVLVARIDRVLVGVVTSGGTMSVALVVVAAILLVFTEVTARYISVRTKRTREKRSELLND